MFHPTRIRQGIRTAAAAANHSNLTWRAALQGGATTGHEFASQPIGTAAANRYVIVALANDRGFGPDTVEIGGIAATYVHSLGAYSYIYQANLSSGTTADFFINFSFACTCLLGYWTVNLDIPAHYSASGNSVGSNSVSQVIAIPVNGFSVGISVTSNLSDTFHSVDSSFLEQAEIYQAAETGMDNASFFHREITNAVSPNVTSNWGDGDLSEIILASWN